MNEKICIFFVPSSSHERLAFGQVLPQEIERVKNKILYKAKKNILLFVSHWTNCALFKSLRVAGWRWWRSQFQFEQKTKNWEDKEENGKVAETKIIKIHCECGKVITMG